MHVNIHGHIHYRKAIQIHFVLFLSKISRQILGGGGLTWNTGRRTGLCCDEKPCRTGNPWTAWGIYERFMVSLMSSILLLIKGEKLGECTCMYLITTYSIWQLSPLTCRILRAVLFVFATALWWSHQNPKKKTSKFSKVKMEWLVGHTSSVSLHTSFMTTRNSQVVLHMMEAVRTPPCISAIS